MTYSLISAQSYVIPPADLWRERLPAALAESAPRPTKARDAFVVGPAEHPQSVVVSGADIMGAIPRARTNPKSTIALNELPSAAVDPKARLAAQDQDSVDAEVLYAHPQLLAAILLLEDAELQRACVQVYNEWLTEFCAVAPERLVGLAQIPTTGADDALAALEAAVGSGNLRGAQLYGFPSGGQAPKLEEDSAFWKRAAEIGAALTVDRKFGNFSVDPEPLLRGALYQMPGISAQLQMLLYTKTLYEHPDLRLTVAGVDAGWVTNWFESTDNNFMRTVNLRGYDLPDPEAMPSDYLRRHFSYTVSSADSVAVRFRRYIGAGHIMWSSGFPKAMSDWPDNRAAANRLTHELSEEDRRAFLAGNAARTYRLPGWQALQSAEPEPVRLPHMLTA